MQGVVTTPRVRGLRRILKRWCSINGQLAREWAPVKDAPWWYNERASLSVFAGAIWRSGEAAFEEYSDLKRGKKRLSSGRIDIWFSVGRLSFCAEAKFCNVPFTRDGDQASGVQWWMDQAKNDARRCPPDGSTRRLAIVFGCPYLRPCSESIRRSRIDWLLEQSRKVEHDAIAWVFPSTSKHLQDDGWLCPGAIMWIKQI